VPCGREAPERLAQFIGGRAVHCEDNGPDPAFRKRHICTCTVEGETMSINRWLVPEGLAINFEPFARGRFQSDEDDARQNRRGWWRGCIAAAQHLRYWRKLVAPLLGSTCANEPNARDKLFPENPEMPPGCSIKGRFAVRAKAPGYRGIYQRRLSQLPHAEEPEPLVLFRGGRPSCRVPKSVHLQRTTRRLSRSTRQMERRPRRQSAGISVEMSSAVPAADTRGPATAARFHMPLPLPLAGERGAGGGNVSAIRN